MVCQSPSKISLGCNPYHYVTDFPEAFFVNLSCQLLQEKHHQFLKRWDDHCPLYHLTDLSVYAVCWLQNQLCAVHQWNLSFQSEESTQSIHNVKRITQKINHCNNILSQHSTPLVPFDHHKYHQVHQVSVKTWTQIYSMLPCEITTYKSSISNLKYILRDRNHNRSEDKILGMIIRTLVP